MYIAALAGFEDQPFPRMMANHPKSKQTYVKFQWLMIISKKHLKEEEYCLECFRAPCEWCQFEASCRAHDEEIMEDSPELSSKQRAGEIYEYLLSLLDDEPWKFGPPNYLVIPKCVMQGIEEVSHSAI